VLCRPVPSAQLDDLVVGVLGGSTEPDVGTAAGHLGGDGDGVQRAGLGDDGRFLGIVLRVEHDGGHAAAQQPVVQLFGFGDVVRADEDRPAGGVDFADVLDDRFDLRGGGDVDAVGLVVAHVGSIRRDR
jgi:hypothetical protein